MTVSHLSSDLYLGIASFLDDNEKIVFGSCCVGFYKDLLLNHLRRFVIGKKSDFLTDLERKEETRDRFTKCIPFPERQVHFYVPKSYRASSLPVPRIYYLNTAIEKLQKLLSQQPPQIEKVHTLDLNIDSTKNYPELLCLGESLGLKHLYISIFGWKELPSLPLILSPSLETLILRGPCLALPTGFEDIFSHLHEVSLSDIECVSDVRMFVNLKKICFHSCPNITDITPLQAIPEIEIEFCKGIVDYRNALTHSHRITIKSLIASAVIDVSYFKAVRSLVLIVPYNATSILNSLPETPASTRLTRLTITGQLHDLFHDALNHLQELTLSSSTTLTRVDMFGCIPIVRLFDLNNVESLDGLGYSEDISKGLRNRSVTISQFRKVQDFTPLNTIPIVEISHCDGFRDISQVKDVKTLIIRYCDELLQPSLPLNNESITLAGEMPDNLLLSLPNVKEVDLSFVRGENLQGLEPLKNLERIVISSYWNEQDTAGWDMLRQDYLKFHYDKDTTIYVKKEL